MLLLLKIVYQFPALSAGVTICFFLFLQFGFFRYCLAP